MEGVPYEFYALHPGGKEYTNQELYIGRTQIGLDGRFRLHIKSSKDENSKIDRFIRENGHENVEVELLERCFGFLEATRLANYWVKELEPGLNSLELGSHVLAGGAAAWKRAYRKANKQKCNEQRRARYQANKQKESEQSKVRYYANHERSKAKDRAYYQENKGRLNALRRYRRALRGGRPPNPEDVPLPKPDAEGL